VSNDLMDRTALVSGASGNLGSAITRQLARAGARVIVHYHQNRKAAEQLVTQIKDDHGDARLCQADLSRAETVAGMFADLAACDWSPDIVVNNAARQPVTMLADMDITQWQEVIAANNLNARQEDGLHRQYRLHRSDRSGARPCTLFRIQIRLADAYQSSRR